MVGLCFENRSEAVAQIFNLPYRRVALGKAASSPQRPQPTHRLSTIRPILEQTQTCPELAEWLNSLPEGKAVCERLARVKSVPSSILPNEISRWQRTGYLDWLRRREKNEQTRDLVKSSLQRAEAAGGNGSLT